MQLLKQWPDIFPFTARSNDFLQAQNGTQKQNKFVNTKINLQKQKYNFGSNNWRFGVFTPKRIIRYQVISMM